VYVSGNGGDMTKEEAYEEVLKDLGRIADARDRQEMLEDLESAVVEAAVNLKSMTKPATPAHAYVQAQSEFMTAIDALIAAREGAE
jgi:hypothetical protein